MAGEEVPAEITPQSLDANRVTEGQPVTPVDPEQVEVGTDEVGEVALQQENRIDDLATAQEMANAADEQMTLAVNLEQSNIPGSADFAQTLREKGDELAEQARADYEQEKANYEQARDYMIGRIVALAKGEIETTDPLVIMGSQMRQAKDWVSVGSTTIKSPQAEELRNLVYQVLGAEKPPEEGDFKREHSTNWWTVETPSKTGVTISETRHRNDSYVDKDVIVDKAVTEEGIGSFVSLSIVRDQEKAVA